MIKKCKSVVLSKIVTLIYTFLLVNVCVHPIKAQNLNDIIITEIMADPTPSKGLPEKEYIEIYNRTDKPILLNKFKLSYNTTITTFPNVSIQAKEYIIIVNKNNEKDFQSYGNVIGLSSFSLLNTGTTLTLRSDKNKTIFSVTYIEKWNKAQGYALEMIDINYPCVEEGNWMSSEATLQGTPGKENSVKASKPDLTAPKLLRYEITNPNTVNLIFSEKLDSLSAISTNAYALNKTLTVKQIGINSPLNSNITLNLNTVLQDNIAYELRIKNIADCSGNLLTETKVNIGNIKPADSGDVVLSEILFNPRSGGEDFVEIYNRSNKLISLKEWSLANIDNTGKPANNKTLTKENYILQPRQFLILTRNAQTIKNHYFKTIEENILEMPSLPSFPNDSGTVMLINDTKQLFDRFNYSEKLHHPLINNKEGISLEKTDYNKSSADTKNWHSAIASEGYATPGYESEHPLLNTEQESIFKIEPEIFTPDGDGQDEVTTLKFQLDQHNYAANIRIFDTNGRFIKTLTQNQLISPNETIEWNGTNNTQEVVPVGYYILLVELFNPSGQTKQFKAKVVVGSRF